MLAHKLVLEDVEEDYHLLALHSSLEEYKLAFYLNKFLQFQLKRAAVDVDFNHGEVQALYPLYSFKQPEKYRAFHLIKNKFKGEVKKVISSGSLFVEEEVSPQITYLIPEFKDVDYFLKVEEDLEPREVNALVGKLVSIPHIITAYTVDVDQLKSKNNLILE
ncbi:IPExxxVDY family protein [Antarcticibacterium flavum]|uniref:IPExxxVDY family protein n=1 Tax=Antarcticibacterium flavum TaxID=2058175 RepID=A0A5B7X518_9FLAO|nr:MULTISPECIES: IPExxxVDY family protein [Antarcticibacterium]MCM4160164.1 IPExxxVDY family protein [Antarcticibacterium sp. W02-3]QCY69713.1 IPExxxVDY family protein [Antarcticibacterium flavum]